MSYRRSNQPSVCLLTTICLTNIICAQARNQRGTKGGGAPLENFSPLPGKMCWTQFKTTAHSSKNLGPFQKKLFATPAVPSWSRACLCIVRFFFRLSLLWPFSYLTILIHWWITSPSVCGYSTGVLHLAFWCCDGNNQTDRGRTRWAVFSLYVSFIWKQK